MKTLLNLGVRSVQFLRFKIFYPIYTQFISVCFVGKRDERMWELRRSIRLILDPAGCDRAQNHCATCDHIIKHYRLTLAEGGYSGSMSQLFAEAIASEIRARKREEATLARKDDWISGTAQWP